MHLVLNHLMDLNKKKIADCRGKLFQTIIFQFPRSISQGGIFLAYHYYDTSLTLTIFQFIFINENVKTSRAFLIRYYNIFVYPLPGYFNNDLKIDKLKHLRNTR